MKNILEDLPAYDSEEMIEILKQLNIEERALKFFNFLNFTRELQWVGIQMRHPGLSNKEIDSKFKEEIFKFYSDNPNNE